DNLATYAWELKHLEKFAGRSAIRRLRQYKIEGRYAPAGSLYNPVVMSVIGSTTRSPFARHHRNSSALRVGTKIPDPPKPSAAAISACKSKLVSATACPK